MFHCTSGYWDEAKSQGLRRAQNPGSEEEESQTPDVKGSRAEHEHTIKGAEIQAKEQRSRVATRSKAGPALQGLEPLSFRVACGLFLGPAECKGKARVYDGKQVLGD